MTQLTQLENLEQTAVQPDSKEYIKIETDVPAIDYVWVKQNIRQFIEENKLLDSLKDVSVHFIEQPVKNNMVKCYITAKLKNKLLTVSGQGIDEYQAVNDTINNLELDILLGLTIQKTNNKFFFSNSINQFQRGGQYA